MAVASSRCCTASTSTPFGTVTSTIARAQPCDWLPMRVSSPFRTYQSTPFTSRIWVTRMPTASTIPLARSVFTTSPTPSWSSATMNRPVSTSLTIVCAPKPRPAPNAAVIRENAPVMFGLITVTMLMIAMIATTAETTLFRTEPSVRVRCTTRAALTGEASSACVSSAR